MKHPLMLAAAAFTFAVSAHAGPITTPPPPITGLGGDVKAVYIFADAHDGSILGLSMPVPAVGTIFCNHNVGGCTASAPGDVFDLGNRMGSMLFTLNNFTSGKAYDSANPDTFGDYHVDIRTSYTYSGVPALSASLMAQLAVLPNVTFVAWEDLDKSNGSDFDYNDLIFAFSNTSPTRNPGIPEPLTLSLVGMGLLGAFGLRRKKA